MYQELHISTSDGHTIYGTLHQLQSAPQSQIIILVHGFACNSRHQLILSGATFLEDHTYDTFRFDLYSSQKKGRTLRESTISINSKDLECVLEELSKTYTQITVIGHSMAGPVILHADPKHISKIILWDPSLRTSDPNAENPLLQYNKDLECFVLNWGIEILVPTNYFENWEDTVGPNHLQKNTVTPIHILLTEKRRKTFEELRLPENMHIHTMKECSHDFESKEQKHQLFTKTLEVISK